MKWFRDGLDKDELKKEYKRLAREHHPDISKDPEATKHMQEINDEFDKYFVVAAYRSTGYSNEDMRSRYKKAKEERSIILAFLRRDKQEGHGFFTFNKHGKIVADGPDWENFHGGFALCKLTKQIEVTKGFFYDNEEVKEQKVEKIAAKIQCPNYADMFYGIKFGGFTSSSTALVDSSIKQKKVEMDEYGTYKKVHTRQYGDFWISNEKVYTGSYNPWMAYIFGRPTSSYKIITWAYVLVNGQIMRCPFNLNKDFYEVTETCYGQDFGFLAFQECTDSEFRKWHTCNEMPEFSEALEMKELDRRDDFWWISDPMIRFFARKGVLKFYQSKRNFHMRYGCFSTDNLSDHLNEMSIDEAEEIQDFLDELNKDYEDKVRGMVKKGKIKINTTEYNRHPWDIWL